MIDRNVVVFKPIFLDGGDRQVVFNILANAATLLREKGIQTIFTQTVNHSLSIGRIAEIAEEANLIVSLSAQSNAYGEVSVACMPDVYLKDIDELLPTYTSNFTHVSSNEITISINYIRPDFEVFTKYSNKLSEIIAREVLNYLDKSLVNSEAATPEIISPPKPKKSKKKATS